MQKQKQFIFIALLAFLSGCSHNYTPAEIVMDSPINKPVSKSLYHIVKQGESLFSIASMYDLSVKEITELNSLKPNTKLHPGQRLLIKAKNKQTQYDENELESKLKLETESTENLDTIVDNQDYLDSLPHANEYTNNATVNTAAGYAKPLEGTLISKFGQQPDGTFNKGINIAAPKGNPVKAIADGVVKYVGSKAVGYGKMVMIKHDDGRISTYTHLNSFTTKLNAIVSKGQKIGTVGSTGNVTRPQLHLQVRGIDKEPVDPLSLIGNY